MTTELKLDPRNTRAHPDNNKKQVRKSLEEVGAGRSILVDKDGIVRAGNCTYGQAIELGYRVRIVEAERDELIAVKRNDLEGEQAIRAAILDNYTGESSTYDEQVISQLLQETPALFQDIDEGSELAKIIGALSTEEMDFSDLDEMLEELDGYDEVDIKITVPRMHEEAVVEWLANGEQKTAPGLGKGVLKRCELL